MFSFKVLNGRTTTQLLIKSGYEFGNARTLLTSPKARHSINIHTNSYTLASVDRQATHFYRKWVVVNCIVIQSSADASKYI